MNYSQRNSPHYGNHRSDRSREFSERQRNADQQREYGGPGQPDYSLNEPPPYAYGEEDDDWRAADNYRRGDFQRVSHPSDTQTYGRQSNRYRQNWRDAPEEWDRFAREQRGSAYEFYRGRRPSQGYQTANRGQQDSPWAQNRRDLSNFPDFDPQDEHYIYPGANQAWDQRGGEQQWGREMYRGYPYSQQDLQRAWQHHPSHDQNEYAQRYDQREQDQRELGGAYGLSSGGLYDSQSYQGAIGQSHYPHNQRSFSGRGPKGYERSDERVREDICERLGRDPHIDASEISVNVKSGVVTLDGSVDDRMQKHRAEDIADSCSGVKDVQNRINVSQRELWNMGQPQRGVDQTNRQGVAGQSDDKTTTTSPAQQNITRQ